mmetsp:Transcript_5092/g.11123  ORF Transcript_5092/g.11123 Transcript_5092/m.11123 type:complete len:85 (+) Transcript_5092:448-702(+)
MLILFCLYLLSSPPCFSFFYLFRLTPSPPLFGADLIRKKGLSQINVEDLVKEITPKGRAMVPDAVKAELLTRIRNFLANDSDAN